MQIITGQITTGREPVEAVSQRSRTRLPDATDFARLGRAIRRVLIVAVLATYPLLSMAFTRLRNRIAEVGGAVATTIVLVATMTAFAAAVLLPESGRDERIAAAMAATPPVHADQPAMLRGATPDAPPVAIPVAITPEAAWLPVRKPLPLFNLEAPEVENSDLSYRVLTRGKNARRDSLTWLARAERPASTRPLVHLSIERHEGGAPTFRPFFPDLAGRAAEDNLAIERISPASEVATKFGGFEVAEAMLATEQGLRSCLLFRRIDASGLSIAGWYCGSAERAADRVSLGCFIDRLDLIGAGSDRDLKQLFARAERERSKGCASVRRPGRKMTWLDHEAPVPPLKLSGKGR